MQNHPPSLRVIMQTYRYIYLALDSTQRNSMESNSPFCKMIILQKSSITMREFHHGSGLGQLMRKYLSTKLTEKDYVLHYLIPTTKICAVLKHSIFLMRNANANFARVLAAIFMKDIVRRWSNVAKYKTSNLLQRATDGLLSHTKQVTSMQFEQF